jgi:hypothetical protein
MSIFRRVPRKVWLLLACAIGMVVFGSSAGWFGPRDPRSAFLDAVNADMAKDPRLAVLDVDHAGGRLVVTVKPAQQTFTLVITKVEAKTMADGPGASLAYEWQGPTGNVITLDHWSGVLGKSPVHIPVPGLPR